MTDWPQFITRDLGDSKEDAAEMTRRWQEYDRQMRALIDKGGVHQDDDGWWVHTATGALIGPDPEIERPRTAEELDAAGTLDEASPSLAAKLRGRPKSENPKQSVSMRLDPDLLAAMRATGKGWQTRANDALRKAYGLSPDT